MQSSNPILKDNLFSREAALTTSTDVMTFKGVVNKTFALIAICFLTSALTWGTLIGLPAEQAGLATGVLIGSAILGAIVAFVTIFKHSWSPTTAPLYAAIQGVVLGSVSLMFERQYPGIVFQAVLLTFGVLFSLLFAYRSGWIRATEKFKIGVFAATGAIAIVYIASMVLGMFGIQIPMIHTSSPVGIAFSVIVVIIASLNFILDFDRIENGVAARAPKYMEWYSGFAILITLVWLYMEILRLLGKVRDRR
ncbi:MAG: Bax inhibitor-1/YccA family protein [Deltaproteobacteria bacterium]|nr:Bax inhibitor-1/YccA family protein [Deltaproteobacteria bacterium]